MEKTKPAEKQKTYGKNLRVLNTTVGEMEKLSVIRKVNSVMKINGVK